ncbi:endonuclease domain-containing protein [Aminobacter sp. AP02]|uniref:endonuclease domain-containing protein n=1 Tax=Aminobacter sp. AP02 TaxID=2135737 RepID=UPI000D7A189B|nr:endonuclease domain-containing protein [Aminobacter sp. AP02]PWK64124.1 uncharacterized protein DUF559 [Aminobacter sp. AP02]
MTTGSDDLLKVHTERKTVVPRTRIGFEMRQKARSLRLHTTKAETLLWYELRELRAAGLKFRRQSPIGPYIVDFLCPSVRLVVEIDGDSHETEQVSGTTPIATLTWSLSDMSCSGLTSRM